MVDELFDGNIASEMTLGEAIVRGILNLPKYVLSVFAYQEDYDKLKLRVSRSKNKAVKDKAEQYLESLRRALEMADGMDVIFDKYITDRIGKYIAFERLVAKLSSLASPFEVPKLVRNVDVENRIKADNEKIYYIMEALNDAINDKKKVSFQYYTYTRNKERVAKHDGKVYLFSPYKMIWNGDYYYVVGYSEKHGSIGSFRVDRIVTTPQILSEEQHEPPKEFDLNVYLNSMFRMYNGERKQVELICDNDLMDAIIDKFGKDVDVSVYDDSFIATVTTSVGNVFYSWIFGFGGRVYINSPEDVKSEYSEMVAAAADTLEK